MTEYEPIPSGAARGVLSRSQSEPSRLIPHESSALHSEDWADGFDLKDLWRILWSRRYWILGAGVLGLLLALAYTLTQKPLYRSNVVLELTPPAVAVLSNSSGGDDFVAPQTDFLFLATQYGLLESRDLATRVVRDLNLVDASDEPGAEARIASIAGAISEDIEVSPETDSRLVNLSFTSESPTYAAKIVNGYAKSYLQSSLDRKFEATSSARTFLKERLDTTRAALDGAERQLVAYAEQNNIIITSIGVGENSSSGTLAGASLESLNSALASAQQRRIAAEQRSRQAGSMTEVNASTASLRQEKATLETEYSEKSTYLQDGFPEMVRLKARIDALGREIRKEAGTASGSLRSEYQAALAEENALQAKVRQLTGNVLAERGRSVQYNILQRELDTNRTLYAALLDRYNQVSVTGEFDTPLAAIVDEGQVPGAPFSPNVPLNLLLGLLSGLGLGAALAYLFEYLTDSIKTADDVREALRLPVLGMVPTKSKKEDLAEQLADPRSSLSEAYASLLTTLQFATNLGFPHALLVTSTVPAEGKSTTSYVLASQLAALGKRVLLLDADLRKPSFVVNEQVDRGLSKLLTTNEDIAGHVLQTKVENLWLLPSGHVPPNPSQLLNSQRMKQILEMLKGSFDCVIVDGPPTHGLADSVLLGSICTGVLFVVESGRVRKKLAKDTVADLLASNSQIVGVALTKTKSSADHYGYGYHYSYASDENSKPHELTPALYLES
jgi:succinoglycan biosynthesis transport protein ExoP